MADGPVPSRNADYDLRHGAPATLPDDGAQHVVRPVVGGQQDGQLPAVVGGQLEDLPVQPQLPRRMTPPQGPLRASRVPGEAVADRTRAHGGFDVDVVDLADIDLPLALPDLSPKADTNPRPAGMARLTDALEAADVTPEYNHSYPASLKAAIDWHLTRWTAKPVAFASYGGPAAETQAKLVLDVLAWWAAALAQARAAAPYPGA